METDLQAIEIVTTLIQPDIEVSVIMVLHEDRLKLFLLFTDQSFYGDQLQRNGKQTLLVGLGQFADVGLITEINPQDIVIVLHAAYH